MAPNKRAGPATLVEPRDIASSVISKEEVEARGSGTKDHGDTYDIKHFWHNEKRVFLTGWDRGYTNACLRQLVLGCLPRAATNTAAQTPSQQLPAIMRDMLPQA